jgi:uncharacterized protein DUF1569
VNVYLQRVQDAIADATRGMNAKELARHTEGKWSTAEILEHLDRTYTGTALHLQKCLDAGAPTASRAKLAQRFIVGIVVKLGYMPSGRKSPEFALPNGLAPEEILRSIPAHIADMDRVLTECERRFGARRHLADHPLLGPLSTEEWRKLHWVHTRHHMKQIARLKTISLDFTAIEN